MKTININGENFQLIKPRNKINPFSGWFCDEQAIYMAYERPSIYKVAIWNEWLKWSRETDGVTAFEITSHNCYMFTIGGEYTDENGQEYVFYITPSSNKAYQVN